MPQSVFPCPVLFCDELDAALDWKRAKVLATVLSVKEANFFFSFWPSGLLSVLRGVRSQWHSPTAPLLPVLSV